MVAAIGIDLAWKESGLTGLCVISKGVIRHWNASAYSNRDLLDIVHSIEFDRCVVTIDAPLVVPNETGIRSCERVFKKMGIHGHFLSVLGSNRTFLMKQFGSIRGELLLDDLTSEKVQVWETFPSASVVGMFGRRIPYKFSTGKTKTGVIKGMHMLLESFQRSERFSRFAGALDVHLRQPLAHAKTGRELKFLEDKIDAFVCAYTAWQLSAGDDQVGIAKGDLQDGSIVFSCFSTPV